MRSSHRRLRRTSCVTRKADVSDADDIARVHVRSWEETYRGKLPAHAVDALTHDVALEKWQRDLAKDTVWTYLHESKGVTDGFASAFRTAAEPGFAAMLSNLYVLRAAHRHGVGRALLAALFGDLLANGIDRIWLLTLRDDNPARRFYEKLGARLVREQPAPAVLGRGVMDVVYCFDDLTQRVYWTP